MSSGNEASALSAIGPLIWQLANDGVRWVEAEISVASAEYHTLRRRLFCAVAFALAAFIFTSAAVLVFAQVGIAAAAIYFNSAIIAGAFAGSFLLVVALLCIVGVRRAFRWRAQGLLARLLGSATDSNPKQQWTH